MCLPVGHVIKPFTLNTQHYLVTMCISTRRLICAYCWQSRASIPQSIDTVLCVSAHFDTQDQTDQFCLVCPNVHTLRTTVLTAFFTFSHVHIFMGEPDLAVPQSYYSLRLSSFSVSVAHFFFFQKLSYIQATGPFFLDVEGVSLCK